MAKQKTPKRPDRFYIPGAGWHRLVVFTINTKEQEGQRRPKLCTVLYDEQSIDLAGGEEFMTGYIPEVMFDRSQRR